MAIINADGEGFYSFNLHTKDLTALGGLSYDVNGFLNAIIINSTIYSYETSTENTVNSSQIDLNITVQNLITRKNTTFMVNNLNNDTGNLYPNFSISPDFSKLALAWESNLYYYKIIDLKPILVKKIPLDQSSGVDFVQWTNSELYYALTYSTTTQLEFLKYNDSSINMIHDFNRSISYIIGLNIKNSYIITLNPGNDESILFFNNSNEQMSLSGPFYYATLTSNDSNTIFWNENEIALMSFNQVTNTFKQGVVITEPNPDIPMLSQIESINVDITILLAIAVIPVSYGEKILPWLD